MESSEVKHTDISELERKMKISGTVIKTTLSGALIDIGLEQPGVIHISQLSMKPVTRVEEIVTPGQLVDVWVRRVEPKRGRVELTMVEPLPLEWREIKKGLRVKGTVSRLEKIGAFIDIGAERQGFIHISELTHGYIQNASDVVKEGDEVEALIINVNRRRKQIKLSLKALEKEPVKPVKKIKKVEKKIAEEKSVPTAMEIALREAMAKAEKAEPTSPKKTKTKAAPKEGEMESILTRTLEHKVSTESSLQK